MVLHVPVGIHDGEAILIVRTMQLVSRAYKLLTSPASGQVLYLVIRRGLRSWQYVEKLKQTVLNSVLTNQIAGFDAIS